MTTQVDQNREDEDGRISQDSATPTAGTNQADNLEGRFVINDERLINLMCRGLAKEFARDQYFSHKIIGKIARQHVLDNNVLQGVTPEILADAIAKNLILLAHNRNMEARDYLSQLLQKTSDITAERLFEELKTI